MRAKKLWFATGCDPVIKTPSNTFGGAFLFGIGILGLVLTAMAFMHVPAAFAAAGGAVLAMPPVMGNYSGSYPREYEQYNSQYGGQIESIGWKLWDTQTYVSGTTTQLPQWFNVRATPDLSNMEVAFQLAAPKAFLVRAIRFFVKQRVRAVVRAANTNPNTGAMDNIAQLINTGVWVFTIGNKVYNMEPLWCLTAGGGACGVFALEGATADPGAAVDYAQNGVPDPRAVNTLSKPIFIAPQINFSAVVTWPAAITLAGTNTDICFLLDGDQLRPVQ